MKQTSLEPGLLSAFRIFTALRLGVILPTAVFHFFFREMPLFMAFPPLRHLAELRGTVQPGLSPYLIFYTVAEAIVIVVYLWWPPWQRLLGRFFLPVGLVIATVGPIIGQHLRIAGFNSSEMPALAGAWQLVVVLFIPLVLIGWQYNFHTVLIYCLGTVLLDAPLVVLAIGWGNLEAPPVLVLTLARTILYIAVGYMMSRMVKAQRQQRHDLAQANTRLTHYATTLEQLSISRERNRLAREMHDTLAHTLSGVTVQLEAVNALWNTDPAAARNLLEQSLATTRTGLTETRRALQALRASPLEDLGLVLAMRHLAESLAARSGLTLNLQLPEQLDDLSPVVEQCIYRVAQEALANVDRHANANHLTVRLNRDNQHFSLTITDNGSGFSPDEVNSDGQFGLKGMQERAEMVGGTLEVNSQPGQGTTVWLTVPVE